MLLYHVSPEFFPAGRVLVTKTIPTALDVETLGIGPQRLSINLSLKLLTVNFYSRIVAINIVRLLLLLDKSISLTVLVRHQRCYPRS